MDLEAVVRDLAPRLLRYAIGRTGSHSLGEEAAQEALTALVQRWRRAGPPESPEAFAFAIVRRRAARAVVRQRLLVPLQALAGWAARFPDPEAQAASSEDGRMIRSAIGQLAQRDRESLHGSRPGQDEHPGAARHDRDRKAQGGTRASLRPASLLPAASKPGPPSVARVAAPTPVRLTRFTEPRDVPVVGSKRAGVAGWPAQARLSAVCGLPSTRGPYRCAPAR